MRTKPASLLRWEDAAHAITEWTGKPWTFAVAVLIIVVWAASGPLFGYSDTWQLVINTGTTIITFLMVFLIQNTQNRDAKAIHLKLDELLKGVKGARTSLVDLEDLSDEQLDDLQTYYERLHKEAASHATKRKSSKKKKR